MSTDRYVVKPVLKALQLLHFLGDEGHELGLTEIAHRIRMPKTSVYRYLNSLCEAGFVTRDDQGLYRLSLKMWELGQAVDGRLRIRQVALPFMQELRIRFNETVNLAILDGREIIYLDTVNSRKSLIMQVQPGSRDPVHSTALGKAIMAFLPESRWPDHLPSSLAALTSQTITSRPELEEELRDTRARGFALDHGENTAGACCIGAPLFGQRRQVLAAISISAPESRLTPQLEQEMTEALLETTLAISHRLTDRFTW